MVQIFTERESPIDKNLNTPPSKLSICSQNFATTHTSNQKYYADKYHLESAFKSVARQSVLSLSGGTKATKQAR
jgi:hypothetical protein